MLTPRAHTRNTHTHTQARVPNSTCSVYDYVRLVAGTSLAAARALINKKCDVALNWFGGRHRASSLSLHLRSALMPRCRQQKVRGEPHSLSGNRR